MRFHVQPRCVPPAVAARRIGLSANRFVELLPQLLSRGFPRPDEVTGNFDLNAIDRYLDQLNPPLFASQDLNETVSVEVVAARFAKARA